MNREPQTIEADGLTFSLREFDSAEGYKALVGLQDAIPKGDDVADRETMEAFVGRYAVEITDADGTTVKPSDLTGFAILKFRLRIGQWFIQEMTKN